MQMLCNCKASQFVGMTISDAMTILELFEDDENFDFWDLFCEDLYFRGGQK